MITLTQHTQSTDSTDSTHSTDTAGLSFDWDAMRYDSQFGYVSAVAEGVVDLLAQQPGERVLDLGCGTGELAATIKDRGAVVTSVDSDPAMVAAATERLGQSQGLAVAETKDKRGPAGARWDGCLEGWRGSCPRACRRAVPSVGANTSTRRRRTRVCAAPRSPRR